MKDHFHINKWYLDFISEEGEAMIFYAATLTWHGITVPYTSWLRYDPSDGLSQGSRFRKVHMPEHRDKGISWSDPGFGITGKWEPLSDPIEARLFESEEGYLDWTCFQPKSRTEVKLKDRILQGSGYVEQLKLTVPPWKIPMDELRWGRFHSGNDHMVWIEIREGNNRKWLWLNGERMEDCIIRDDRISLPAREITLQLDKGVVLESERKIYAVVQKLLHYLPGFNRVMPIKFLMSDEVKWFSKGQYQKGKEECMEGRTIHECVTFRA